MKKIIALLLSFTLVSGIISFGTVFADTDALSADESLAQKLVALGILEQVESENSADYPVSRGEFINIAMRLCWGNSPSLIQNEGEEIATGFIDVRPDEYYAKAVDYATKLGIVKGYGDSYFYPNNAITYSEAIKLLVSVMGYGLYAEESGGYPTGYIVQASRMGLLKGVAFSDNAELTFGQMLQLLDNSLEADALSLDSIGPNPQVNEAPLMESRLDIFSDTGVLSDNGISAISGDTGLSLGRFKIGNNIYQSSDPDLVNYLGYSLKVYYKEGNNNVRDLIYFEVSDSLKEVVIDSDDIVGFTGGVLRTADESGKEKRYSLSSDLDVIYNGKYIQNFTADIFSPEDGYVKLLDDTSSDTYNVAIIYDYKTIVVNSIDGISFTVYDKYDGSNSVVLDQSDGEDHIVTMRNEDGEDISFGDISVGSVLAVAVSQDSKYVQAILYSKNVQGVITEIREEQGSATVKIGETEVEMSTGFYQYLVSSGQMFKVGDTAKLSLGYKDCAVASDEDLTSQFQIGYLVDAMLDGVFESELRLKVFHSTGEMQTLTCAKNIKTDGDKRLSSADMYNRLLDNTASESKVKNAPIAYKTGADGQVVYIGLAADDVYSRPDIDSLYLSYSGYTEQDGVKTPISSAILRYKRAQSCFGFKVSIGPDTKIFRVPDRNVDREDEVNFSVENSSYFSNDWSYSVDSYQFSPDNLYADVVVMYEHISDKSEGLSESVNDTGVAVVVSKIGSKLDADAMPVDKLTVYINGRQEDIYAETGTFNNVRAHKSLDGVFYKELFPGDIIRYRTNKNGMVTAIEVVMGSKGARVGDDGPVTPELKEIAMANPSSSDILDLNRMSYGIVYAKDGDVFKFCLRDNIPDDGDYQAQFDLESHNISSYTMTIVDMTSYPNISVSGGSLQNILDYRSVGDDVDSVFIQTRYGDGRNLILYKY